MGKPYQCFECNKSFLGADNLSQHGESTGHSTSNHKKMIEKKKSKKKSKGGDPSTYSGGHGLHMEIIKLSKRVKPSVKEAKIRKCIIEQVTGFVQSVWERCDVKIYGSTATGLDIYSSDLDLCIHDWKNSRELEKMGEAHKRKVASNQLGKLARNARKRCPWMKKLEVRRFAKVPIINFIHRRTQIEVDVSLDGIGPDTTGFVKQSARLYGDSFVHLSRVLKLLLQQRELDQPFNGGLGSFRIYVMVTYLMERRKKEKKRKEMDFGKLLIEFCELFGIDQDCHPDWPSTDCILNAGVRPHRVELHFRGIRKLGAFVEVLQELHEAITTSLKGHRDYLSQVFEPVVRS